MSHGPFASWDEIAASGAHLLLLRADDSEVRVDSDELSDEELAQLIEIPDDFESDDWDSADWPPARVQPTFASLEIGLRLNGVPWALLRSRDLEGQVLVPTDAASRPEYELIGQTAWYSDGGWSDSTGESIERWRDVSYFSGPYFEMGETDRVFRDHRPPAELFEDLLGWSLAWEQHLVWLEISSPHVSTEKILEMVEGPVGEEDGLTEITVNETEFTWVGEAWQPTERDMPMSGSVADAVVAYRAGEMA